MEFNIYDIYADASIDLETKLGCAGIVTVNRKTDTVIDQRYMYIENATNNRCEIMGIWMAIYRAIELLYTEYLAFHVNIFSDSQISLFGMREWFPGWVDKRRGNTLFNSSGPVANQPWFTDSYHAILSSGLKLKFWHQKGHVDPNNPSSLFVGDRTFRTSNVNSPHMIGTTPQILAKYNNLVDENSRNIIQHIQSGGSTQDFYPIIVYPQVLIPMRYSCYTVQDVELYKTLIKGGLNYPINFVKS